MNKKRLSAIIPCYNEEENIREIYQRLKKILQSSGYNYEMVFINNGSTDNSQGIFRDLVEKDLHVRIVVYSRNFGPHGAYTGGLEYVKGDAVVCIDGDLQDPPEVIAQMIKKWEEGYEVVYGIRKNRKGGKLRKILTILYYRVLNKLSYVPIPLDSGDFALIDRKVVDLLNHMPEHNKYIAGLRAWVGFRQIGIEYNRADRLHGRTKFRLIDYFRWAIHNIISFSHKPLELISYLAILVAIMTLFGIFVYLLDFFFYPNNPRGFITLILVILFLGGIQILCLSIIGQYLSGIFEEVKNRPYYIVKEILQNEVYKKTKKT